MHSQDFDFRCIAVDMGAGSIRVMLGVIGDSKISYEEIHRINNEIITHGGHDCWEMDRIVMEIRKGISKIIDTSPGGLSSIGVDSWGVDFVLLNHMGDLVERPVAYRDKRTVGMRENWENMMPEMETFRRTGINFYIFNSLFQLLALKDSETISKTSQILFIPCYINYLLSGKMMNELTISSTSQMLEVNGDRWEAKILDLLKLDSEIFGDVIPSGTRLGPVIIPEAVGTGMESIAVCGHDTACVVAAIPVENPNFAFISAGTWCIVGAESDHPLISQEALNLGLTNEKGYGNKYHTLKNIVGLWLLQGLKKHLPDNTTYSEMERLTLESDPVMQVIDPDDPGFYNPTDMKEAFDAYLLKTGQAIPDHFSGYLQCAYDSLCFSFRYHIEKLEHLSGHTIDVLHVVGGGSQSDYLNHRIATICHRKVISGPVEGATLGNILIQGITMGRIKNLEEGRNLVRISSTLKTYHPREESTQTIKRYTRFLELQELKNE